MKRIIIFGAGYHANVCIDIFEKTDAYQIVGIVDSIAEIGSTVFGYPVIGRQEHIADLCLTYNANAGFVAIGDNYSRKFVQDFIVTQVSDFEFVNAIHPSVCIGRETKLGCGIMMAAGVIVNPGCTIEDFCILNTGAQLEHNSYMGEYSHLSCASITGGKVSIGRFAAITLGVTLIDRISIGENTVVGSGSLVINDLPDNVLAYGNPAKIIRHRVPGEKFLKSK